MSGLISGLISGLASDSIRIAKLTVGCYRIPTDHLEADGTLEWRNTTLVTVHVQAGTHVGFGYTYCHRAAAAVIEDTLKDQVIGEDPLDVPRIWTKMVREIRNIGRAGAVSSAIAAVDIALWDLKAKIFGVPLVKLMGAARDSVALYGSGGFTSYDEAKMKEQLGGWARQGFKMVKMKIGTHPEDDVARVQLMRKTLGHSVGLFVDANGAYTRKQALKMAERFAELDVAWFEEPVSSDDLEGLRLMRDRAPAGMDITAGEYGYDLYYFRRMLEAGAVDILQADASRCGGLTGFIGVASLCESRGLKLSAHTAPSLHAHVCCALEPVIHLEYFHDHERIEHLFFEGALKPTDGRLKPDLSRPGLGIELKTNDVKKYAL